MTGYLYAPIGKRHAPGGYGTRPTVDHLCHAVATLTVLHGTPPTMRELAAALGIGPGVAHALAAHSVELGRLGHEPRLARTLRVLTPPEA